MPNLPYTRDIPHSTHNPSSDQPIMEVNNNSNDTLWAVDHFGFNDNNGGLHKQVHLKNQSAPGIGTVDGVLYSNVNPANSWPFWQNSLGSFPLITQPTINAFDGSATLPGGIILKWGVVSASSGNGVVTFVTPFPTGLYNVQLTIVNSNIATNHAGAIYVLTGSTSAAGFTWRMADPASATAGFLWFAIGS